MCIRDRHSKEACLCSTNSDQNVVLAETHHCQLCDLGHDVIFVRIVIRVVAIVKMKIKIQYSDKIVTVLAVIIIFRLATNDPQR